MSLCDQYLSFKDIFLLGEPRTLAYALWSYKFLAPLLETCKLVTILVLVFLLDFVITNYLILAFEFIGTYLKS